VPGPFLYAMRQNSSVPAVPPDLTAAYFVVYEMLAAAPVGLYTPLGMSAAVALSDVEMLTVAVGTLVIVGEDV